LIPTDKKTTANVEITTPKSLKINQLSKF